MLWGRRRRLCSARSRCGNIRRMAHGRRCNPGRKRSVLFKGPGHGRRGEIIWIDAVWIPEIEPRPTRELLSAIILTLRLLGGTTISPFGRGPVVNFSAAGAGPWALDRAIGPRAPQPYGSSAESP